MLGVARSDSRTANPTAAASRLRRMVGAALAAIVVLTLLPATASAHALYARSTPADGAVLRQGPARVDMWTDSEMYKRSGANTLTVTGPSGAVVNQGPTHLDDSDRTHLWVELQPGLRPGIYTVAWQTLSADDQEQATGTFTFTVDPNATPTAATPTSAATAPPTASAATAPTGDGGSGTSGGGVPVPAWAAITALALVIAAGIAAVAILAAPAGDPAHDTGDDGTSGRG